MRIKVFCLVLSLLFTGQLYALELGDFSEVFTRAPNTVNAYNALCGGKSQLGAGPLSDDQWRNICEVVKESDLCKDVPDEERIQCIDQDEDQIDITSFGFFWNCIRGLGAVFMDMIEFIKEAIFMTVGYAFDSDTRDEVNQQVGDLYDGLSLYISNEYAHLKEENPDSSKATLWAMLAGDILGDALSFLGDLIKESLVSLGCYHQDAREKKACEYVFSVTVPPASFFALYKLGPKGLKQGKKLLGKREKSRGNSDSEETNLSLEAEATRKVDKGLTQDIDEILKEQAHLKPTKPRKKVAIKGLNEDYWKEEAPVLVRKGDQSLPVTYSFDSEIPHSAVFNLLYSKPESTAKLTSLLRGLKVKEKTGAFGRTKLVPYRVGRDDLKKVLEKSDKQLNTFVLRRGVDPDKEYFDLTDINASYVDDFMVPMLKKYNKDKDIVDLVGKDFDSKSVDEFFDGYRKLADDIFSKEDIPADATRDQMWIEMVHKSSESSPGEFRELMLERYRPLTNSASSHLHVGVPAIVSEKKMLSISRAVEARIILESARTNSRPVKLYATSYSTLKRGASSANRNAGVVRMNTLRFSKPHKAHDLEIRQYNSMEEGMNNIALVGNLARQHERIKVIDMPDLPKIDDPSTSNLTGALTYAAKVLESSGDTELTRKAARLKYLVDDIHDQGVITEAQRVKVQDVLKEENILKFLNEDYLLESTP